MLKNNRKNKKTQSQMGRKRGQRTLVDSLFDGREFKNRLWDESPFRSVLSYTRYSPTGTSISSPGWLLRAFRVIWFHTTSVYTHTPVSHNDSPMPSFLFPTVLKKDLSVEVSVTLGSTVDLFVLRTIPIRLGRSTGLRSYP